MRKDRTLFKHKYIRPFTVWMEAKGCRLQDNTNPYERLRFMKLDHALEVVSYFKSERAEALTIFDRSAELFTDFLKETETNKVK